MCMCMYAYGKTERERWEIKQIWQNNNCYIWVFHVLFLEFFCRFEILLKNSLWKICQVSNTKRIKVHIKVTKILSIISRNRNLKSWKIIDSLNIVWQNNNEVADCPCQSSAYDVILIRMYHVSIYVDVCITKLEHPYHNTSGNYRWVVERLVFLNFVFDDFKIFSEYSILDKFTVLIMKPRQKYNFKIDNLKVHMVLELFSPRVSQEFFPFTVLIYSTK